MHIHSNKISLSLLVRVLFLSSVATVLSACGGGDEPSSSSSAGGEQNYFSHKENVFAEVDTWYVNSHWADNVKAEGFDAIAINSTAVWLERIADVEAIPAGTFSAIPGYRDEDAWPKDGMGLAAHLEEAKLQGNALLQLVIYNLPGRDCHETISHGELPATQAGMEWYKHEFVDRIHGILAQYPEIPIVTYLEPYSLPYLVTGRLDPVCMEVNNLKPHGYAKGVRYAINKLSELQNVHIYLDIGSSAKFGWDGDLAMTSMYMHGVLEGFEDIAELAQQTADSIESSRGSTGLFEGDVSDIFSEPPALETEQNIDPPGYGKIDGFVSNIADYVPFIEGTLGDPRLPEGAYPLRSAIFYDWNPRVDERTYTQDWLLALKDLGADISGLGVVVDSGRNGWGQARLRLRGVAVTQDYQEVDSHRIDQRLHRRNDCNQQEAGLGDRPQAVGEQYDWVDAFVWIKPPGESDGNAQVDLAAKPDWIELSPRLRDPQCDPNELSRFARAAASTEDLNITTGAIGGSPYYSQWFPAFFQSLVYNAWPDVCAGVGQGEHGC